MSAVRRYFALLVVVAALFSLVGCQADQSSKERFQWKPLYGDFTTDTSEVVAQVGDIAITQRMVDLFIDELPPRLKVDFNGADGERLALKKMIDQVLMVQGAMDLKIYNDQDVARQLISQRRNTLDYAMRNYGLLRDNKPAEKDLREYYAENKAKYRQQGMVMARHIETLNKNDADLAYQRLQSGDYNNNFSHVVAEMSTNDDTRKESGNTGWFAKGGFIPFIRSSEQFATVVYELKIGLHEPIKVADRWHVVEVTHREHGRPQTFTEAEGKVMKDMLPAWQDAIIKDYLLDARKTLTVQMLGKYTPGEGATAEELFKRAMAVAEPLRKLELLSMIHTDFPTSAKADDALFMSANLALEMWEDRRVAGRYLSMLIDEYPASDLIEDAKFLRKNLNNPKIMNPQSIEDLRQN